MAEDQEDELQQDKPDPNVYQPDQEDDDVEIDRRIRRAHERLKRMTMVGFPQINETFGCQDTLTVEGGFDTGWAINYIDCGEQEAREGPPTPPVFPCCPTAMLVCDQISADASLCGFSAFDGSGGIYLTRSWSTTGSWSCGPPPPCGGTASGSWSASGSSTYDPDTCEITCECTGSGSGDIAFTGIGCTSANCSGTLTASSCTGSSGNPCGFFSGVVQSTECAWTSSGCPPGAAQGYLWSCLGGASSEDVNSATERVTHYDHATGLCTQTGTKTETLSDEAGNSCDDAVANLPEYSGDYETYFCEASKFSSDGYCAITRFRYKFTFESPLEEECTICWIVRTYDGDGNPTNDEHMCETIAAGETESSVHEALEPDTNGTKSVIYPIGECCTDGVCTVTDEASCAGTYQGDSCANNPCSPNPCPPP